MNNLQTDKERLKWLQFFLQQLYTQHPEQKPFNSKSLMKFTREQSSLDIHTKTGNLKGASMCDVTLVPKDKKSWVAQVAMILFGTADDDVWNIINGFARPDTGGKEISAARVRGFVFSKLTKTEKETFMSSLGHRHELGTQFKHMLVKTVLTPVERKTLKTWIKNNQDPTAVSNYLAAVEGIKNVYGYDLINEKKI